MSPSSSTTTSTSKATALAASSASKDTTTGGGSSSSSVSPSPPIWCPEQQIYIDGVIPSVNDDFHLDELLDNESGGSLRVFGYGSLCWNPGTGVLSNPNVTCSLGHVYGYQRCWAQRSTDHRGTPNFPGLVCTLLTTEEVKQIKQQQQQQQQHDNNKNDNNQCNDESDVVTVTEGLIYLIPPNLVQECLDELDFREKGGYARDIIDVVEESTQKSYKALLYRGTPDNPAFSPRALCDLPYAAAIMSISHGPSGPNDVYLYQLNDFLLDAAKNCNDGVIVSTDDTCVLSNITKQLQQQQLHFCTGAGSNQYNQLLQQRQKQQHQDNTDNNNDNNNNKYYCDDLHELSEIIICTENNDHNSNNMKKTGSNSNNNGNNQQLVPKPKQLFAGGGHSGLLMQNGELYLWGWNDDGQLGSSSSTSSGSGSGSGSGTDTGSSSSSSIPFSVVSALQHQHHHQINNIETAALGFSHTLIIEAKTRQLYAFGNNQKGQVTGCEITTSTTNNNDDNNNTKKANTVVHNSYEQPQIPSFLLEKEERFVAVAAGLFHSAAITESTGELVMFGCNRYGQLGYYDSSTDTDNNKNNNNNTSQKRRRRYYNRWKPNDGSRIVQVACGRYHTVALDDQQRVWTFGDNTYGQLGRRNNNSNIIDSSTTTTSQNDNNDDDDAVNDNSSNRNDSTTTSTGTNGQKTSSSSKKKKRVKKMKNIDPIPTLVEGSLGIKNSGCYNIICGWSHCIALVDKKAVAERSNMDTTTAANGDDGDEQKQQQPQVVFGWGRNDRGQLGKVPSSANNVNDDDGDDDDLFKIDTPTEIFTEDVLPPSKTLGIQNIVCGSEYTIVAAVTTNIAKNNNNNVPIILYGCGWNEHGNLGFGHTNDVHELTRIVPSVNADARLTRIPPSYYDFNDDNDNSSSSKKEPNKKNMKTKKTSFLLAAGGAHFLAMKTIIQ